jgi:hypothetical protein
MPEVNRIESYDVATLSTIVEIDPSNGIRALRATRPRGVRKDDEEPENRRKLFAAAYRLLGRESKAEKFLADQARQGKGRQGD